MEQFELAEEEDSILSSNTKFNKYERYEILDINSKNTLILLYQISKWFLTLLYQKIN